MLDRFVCGASGRDHPVAHHWEIEATSGQRLRDVVALHFQCDAPHLARNVEADALETEEIQEVGAQRETFDLGHGVVLLGRFAHDVVWRVW